MKFVRGNWLRLLIWLSVAMFAITSLLLMKNAERDAMERLNPYLRVMRLREKEHEAFHAADRDRLSKLIREGKMKANQPAAKIGVPLESLARLKTRWNEFNDAEKTEFASNFTNRYKPALEKWCDAFSGRVPFSPASVTTNNFAERIGTTPAYREYIFVVDGITLGIQDKNGVARVDYLNAPRETGKLTQLPQGEATIATTPISKDEVIKILATEGGVQFQPHEIRVIPSGYSGSLNGGAFVHVGGDPNNAASWKYDMVFGADGKLAYYLKGVESKQ